MSTYDTLLDRLKQVQTLRSAAAVVGWDAQVMLPDAGTAARGEQLALLSRLAHERFTSPEIGDLLGDLDAEGDTVEAATARETRRSYERACKVPGDLVAAISRQETLGQAAWEKARTAEDFASFEPHLAEMMRLKREEAQAVGSASGDPYDALLDDYEPHATAAELEAVFADLKGPLVELVAATQDKQGGPDFSILTRKFPAKKQQQLAHDAAEAVGFDFSAGRMDKSAHPFCSGVDAGDTRITTRYDERFFGDAFFGTLHEAGHAMYEQGLPKAEHAGTPLAQAVSLGIHESQSRMWENLVGRSVGFWRWAYPEVQQRFRDALWDVTAEEFNAAVNTIQPSLIRTESDEATYNLHVLIRFELERALLSGDLATPDLPGAWDDKYRDYLGVTAPSVADGCLQDVHWSAGLIGYFPTYTLGNLYASQFYEQATDDLGDLEEHFAEGEFAPLLGWLREHVHQHGSRYPAKALCERVTGKPLTSAPLLRHLRAKARRYYGVELEGK